MDEKSLKFENSVIFLLSEKRGVRKVDMTAMIVAMSIPSAITGFCFWALERKIARREALQDKKDEARKRNEVLVIQGEP